MNNNEEQKLNTEQQVENTINQQDINNNFTNQQVNVQEVNNNFEQSKKKSNKTAIIIVTIILSIILLFVGLMALVFGLFFAKTNSMIKGTKEIINKNINDINDLIDKDYVYEKNSTVSGSSNEVNIILVGDENQNYKDLALAISKSFNGDLKGTKLNCPESRLRGISTDICDDDISTNSRKYEMMIPGNYLSSIKKMIVDHDYHGAVAVISVKEGPTSQIKEYLSLLNKSGVSKVVIYLDECDSLKDESKITNVEKEIRNLLNTYAFDKDNTPIIRGAASKALTGDSKWENTVKELMNSLDQWIDNPQKDDEKDFLMSIEDVFTITGRGTVVTGRIESGNIKLDDEVEIVGINETRKSVIKGIEMFRKQLDTAVAGDNVGLQLSDVLRSEVERGQVLAKVGTIKPHTKFSATVYMLSEKEGGKTTAMTQNYEAKYYFRTSDIEGKTIIEGEKESIAPGGHGDISVELSKTVAMKKGDSFSIRENGKTIGVGIVTKIID